MDPCTPPGVTVAVDSFDALPVLNGNFDAQSVSIAEPFLGAGVDRLDFTVELADLTDPVPAGAWYVLWNRPVPDAGADRNYVAIKSTGLPGGLTFEHGTVSPPNANVATKVGDLTGSVDFTADTFKISADPALFDGIGAGDDMPGVELRTFAGIKPGDGGAVGLDRLQRRRQLRRGRQRLLRAQRLPRSRRTTPPSPTRARRR